MTAGSNVVQLSPSFDVLAGACARRQQLGEALGKRLAYESPSRERQRESLAVNPPNVTSVIAQRKSFSGCP